MPSLLKWEGNMRRKTKSKKWDQMEVCLVAQSGISISFLHRPWSFVGSFPNTIPAILFLLCDPWGWFPAMIVPSCLWLPGFQLLGPPLTQPSRTLVLAPIMSHPTEKWECLLTRKEMLNGIDLFLMRSKHVKFAVKTKNNIDKDFSEEKDDRNEKHEITSVGKWSCFRFIQAPSLWSKQKAGGSEQTHEPDFLTDSIAATSSH